jgi:succinate dehydrogenase hydrophobic anchor subunit
MCVDNNIRATIKEPLSSYFVLLLLLVLVHISLGINQSSSDEESL